MLAAPLRAMIQREASLLALAQGLPAAGTRARLEAATPGLGGAPTESEAWVGALEFLQGLRLQVQMAGPTAQGSAGAGASTAPDANPNLLEVVSRNHIDLRSLQRIELDHQR